ncbi:ABC transporter permease [Rhodococcus globerulus]|uniref:Transport permease protein n=1 Tax=Rhodococcus globerulus TaxID=33008 RepID=A0ABU4BRZ2_RHOGO|nr:ABC transporter permease [Rhodococcus globerulus]MDV6266798.1 ABC transporter permease [Rhodococcus globerulus]
MTDSTATEASTPPAPPSNTAATPFGFRPRDQAHHETSLRALSVQSGQQCKRILIKWSRDPVTLAQSLLYPALMVLMFRLVLGESISERTGVSSSYGMVPMVALVGAMAGASVSGIGLRRELAGGMLHKFWTMPVHRSSALLGRLCAEVVRILVTTVLIFVVGTFIGFRIETGILGLLGMLGVAVLFGISFSIMVTAITLLTNKSTITEWIAITTNLLMFFNSGFVPVDAYPTWLQPVVEYQPLSCAVDAIRGLALNGEIARPMFLTCAWSVGILAVFLRPAVVGYRKASRK